MHLKPFATVATILALTLSPGLPVFDAGLGAAFAKGEKGGGEGNGGGDRGGNGGNGGNGRSGDSDRGNKGGGKADAKGSKGASAATGGAGQQAVVASGKAAKRSDGLHPSDLGKMNGALNANINAVLAHIRNGQTTNGPVGLLAGLAVAESLAAGATEEAKALAERAADFTALDEALKEAGFASPEDYLQAKEDGLLTEEEIAAIQPLVDAVGGTDDTGLALAEAPPTAQQLADAAAAETKAETAITEAEQAIREAMNKDTDPEAVLDLLRDRIEENREAIDAAVTETLPEEETALAQP